MWFIYVCVCVCGQDVKVCVLWDYFQYSRIFAYPPAQCLQTGSQNDLELMALGFVCVNGECMCMQCVYSTVCVHTP